MQQIIPETIENTDSVVDRTERIGAMITVEKTPEGDRLEIFVFDKQNTMDEPEVLRGFSDYLDDACKFAINRNLKQVQVKTKNLVCPAFDPRAVLKRKEAYQALLKNNI